MINLFVEGVSKARFSVIARSKTEVIQVINNDLWIASCLASYLATPRSRNDEIRLLAQPSAK
jgi:hypothetical protein